MNRCCEAPLPEHATSGPGPSPGFAHSLRCEASTASIGSGEEAGRSVKTGTRRRKEMIARGNRPGCQPEVRASASVSASWRRARMRSRARSSSWKGCTVLPSAGVGWVGERRGAGVAGRVQRRARITVVIPEARPFEKPERGDRRRCPKISGWLRRTSRRRQTYDVADRATAVERVSSTIIRPRFGSHLRSTFVSEIRGESRSASSVSPVDV